MQASALSSLDLADHLRRCTDIIMLHVLIPTADKSFAGEQHNSVRWFMVNSTSRCTTESLTEHLVGRLVVEALPGSIIQFFDKKRIVSYPNLQPLRSFGTRSSLNACLHVGPEKLSKSKDDVN